MKLFTGQIDLENGSYKLNIRDKDFYITDQFGFLVYSESDEQWADFKQSRYCFNKSNVSETKKPKQHTFTEFEKELLKQGYSESKYITRDENNKLYVHKYKPRKHEYIWGSGVIEKLIRFNHLFESVQWSDEEPCEWGKWV
jgi:hypothetical protein